MSVDVAETFSVTKRQQAPASSSGYPLLKQGIRNERCASSTLHGCTAITV